MLLDIEDVRRILIVGCDMHACDELIVNVKVTSLPLSQLQPFFNLVISSSFCNGQLNKDKLDNLTFSYLL